MRFTIDDLVDDFLLFEKPVKPLTFMDRVHNFAKRREIEKALDDERLANEAKVLKHGNDTEAFLNSIYYRDIIAPMFRRDIKGGFQRLILDGENLTESQIKSELAVIKSSIVKIKNLEGKVALANSLRKKE